MNYLNFERTPHRYRFVEGESASLRVLAYYLTDDFSCDDISFNSWINWFNDEKYNATSSNITYTIKLEEDDIEIHWLFDENENEPSFQMNRVMFIKFLHEWRHLSRQNPRTIRVIQDNNGDLSLEGKVFPSVDVKEIKKPFSVSWISKIKDKLINVMSRK